MSEAVFTFSQHAVLARARHSTRLTLHWLLMLGAAAGAALGLAVIYVNKERNLKPHFTSWHGCVGVAAVAGVCVQASVGVVAKYPRVVGPWVESRVVAGLHAVCGAASYFLGVASITLAFWSGWAAQNYSSTAIYLFLALHVFLVAVVIKRVYHKYFVFILKRLKGGI